MPDIFIPSAISSNLQWSLAVLGFCLATRCAVEWGACCGRDPIVARRRRFTVRAVTNAMIAIGLLGIWLAEIQNALFSLTAVLVALVVATKELIMCVAGSILRFGGHLFKVGDRIELNGIHGEVVDHSLFSTTIMELPPVHAGFSGTGRTVMLPNSVLLSGPVKVEAQPRQFAPHRFTLTMEQQVRAGETIRIIAEAARVALEGDRELASRFHQFASRKAGAEISGPETTIVLGTSDIGKMQFQVTIYCLVKDASQLQNAIISAVLDTLEQAASRPADAERSASGQTWSELANRLKAQVPSAVSKAANKAA
ncbi:mechanosensitive ion channel family protein [Fulvimarina sp. 2208YS6-2-32]|uniref:Small-conductance mechanosensitive channel n=1 Tax=Fulvimarina uroteuthidis TaxID=3098149 RepID=A0ABU5I1I3_9HYPH|nr:mechanosensitive ion channel family protein [Fulvimarina sp. 2208YS6-2-32]MDY8109207.1 mechanosensitive ion channel family protein [Fulvimarina sp. 2208YS6-2-32]